MKCPLQSEYTGGGSIRDENTMMDCLKEGCAWWVETQDRCAIKDIALTLGFISLDATQLLEKLPRAGRSRK